MYVHIHDTYMRTIDLERMYLDCFYRELLRRLRGINTLLALFVCVVVDSPTAVVLRTIRTGVGIIRRKSRKNQRKGGEEKRNRIKGGRRYIYI